MILQSLEKQGGDSRVVVVKSKEGKSSTTIVVAAGQKIKVPDDYKYKKEHFKKLEKLPRRRYEVVIKGNTKIRKSLISYE